MGELFTALNQLSLGAAIAVVGSIVGGLSVFLAWIAGILRERRQVTRITDDLDDRIERLSQDLGHLGRQVERMQETDNRTEEKIDRVTALMIEYFSNRGGK